MWRNGSVRMILLVTLSLQMSLGAGCERRSETQPSERSTTQPLRIALNIWPGYGAFLIAEDKGFYAEAGVPVEIEIIQGDPEREAALAAGKIDGIGMTMDNLVVLRDKGINVKAIYKYDGSFGADGIVAKKGIQSPPDLKGKRVAWAPGTTSHFFLTQVLKKYGLTTKDLVHVAMASDDAGSAFAAGHLDAAVTWEPWLSKAKEMPDGHVLITTKELPVVEDVLFVREETLKERRGEVVKMLKACFRAVEYWKTHKKEGNAIIAKRLSLPIEDVESMLSGIKIMDLADNKRFFGTEASPGPAYEAFDSAVDAWLKEGIIKAKQSAKDGIDPTLIAELK